MKKCEGCNGTGSILEYTHGLSAPTEYTCTECVGRGEIPVPRFIYFNRPTVEGLECSECGAMVVNTVRHVNWHEGST